MDPRGRGANFVRGYVLIPGFRNGEEKPGSVLACIATILGMLLDRPQSGEMDVASMEEIPTGVTSQGTQWRFWEHVVASLAQVTAEAILVENRHLNITRMAFLTSPKLQHGKEAAMKKFTG